MNPSSQFSENDLVKIISEPVYLEPNRSQFAVGYIGKLGKIIHSAADYYLIAFDDNYDNNTYFYPDQLELMFST